MVKRARWKTITVLIGILLVGILTVGFFVGKMGERKEFVSKVTAGYRYRCTLSPDWKLSQSSSTRDYHRFTNSSTPIREWIAIHLFHQQPSPTKANFPDPRPALLMRTYAASVVPNPIKIQGGYPEPIVRGPGIGLSERHLHIDGCPATVIRIEVAPVGTSQVMSGTCLYVSLPDFSETYSLLSFTYGTKTDMQYRDQTNREMEAIVTSFHVEKVPAPVSGKK